MLKNLPSELCNLFLSQLCDEQYEDFDEIQSDLTTVFESRPANFYKRGIEQLTVRWTKVVENDDDYIVD